MNVKGKILECLKWDATAGIRRGIAKYIAAVEIVCPGWTPKMYNTYVPLKHQETTKSIRQRPLANNCEIIECPDCLGTFDAKIVDSKHRFPAGTKRKVTDVFEKQDRVNHLLSLIHI